MSWLNLGSLGGWVALLALAWAVGGFRRPLPWRTVIGGGTLMLALGMVIFWVPASRTALLGLNGVVLELFEAGKAGARFLFGPLALNPGESSPTGEVPIGFVLAAQVLPLVIFFAALMALLYYVGAVQPVIALFARVFHRALGLSGAESLAGSANVFVGVEATVTVRPYLERMTRSELLTVLTCGMSTVASTTLALYVSFLVEPFPQIAGHLISASVLSIPAAAIVSKLMLPETAEPVTRGAVPELAPSERSPNALAALASGSQDGLRLAAGIATLLIAVLGVVAVIDLVLLRSSGLVGAEIDTGRLLGWLFTPLAWLLGIDGADLTTAARLLGRRAVLTEVVAYQQLGVLAAQGALTPRTVVVLSYALCGFAHVASIGVFVGGASALAPSRAGELAALGPRALLGATLATLMTGALAGALYHGQSGLVGG